jgi:hypothetical protein
MCAALSWEYTGARELCVELFTSYHDIIGAKKMMKRTTALATSIALIATASIANAKDNHHNNNNQNGAQPHFVITGQPANAKGLLRERTEKKDKHAEKKREKKKKEVKCKKNNCEKPKETTKKESPGKPAGDQPAPHPSVITVSNGVTKYTLPYDPKFSVEVLKPGTITVRSGDRTVTLPGGSITVHGQALSQSVADRAGLEQTRTSQGDTVFAVKPPTDNDTLVKRAGNGPVEDVGLGGQLKGAAKDIGNGLENLGTGFINWGGPTPREPKTGTVTQE